MRYIDLDFLHCTCHHNNNECAVKTMLGRDLISKWECFCVGRGILYIHCPCMYQLNLIVSSCVDLNCSCIGTIIWLLTLNETQPGMLQDVALPNCPLKQWLLWWPCPSTVGKKFPMARMLGRSSSRPQDKLHRHSPMLSCACAVHPGRRTNSSADLHLCRSSCG